MEAPHNQTPPVDRRILVYRGVLFLVTVLLVSLGVKWLAFDTMLIETDQMEPTLLRGDRILVFKGFKTPRARLPRGRCFVFSHPRLPDALGCLRITARSGDTLEIIDGTIRRNEDVLERVSRCATERLPVEFSPRDNMGSWVIACTKDTMLLSELSLRDFIFAASMYRQERPDGEYRIRPSLLINDSLHEDFTVENFALHTGPLSAIADSLSWEWFFWDRLQAYLQSTLGDKHIELTCQLIDRASVVTHYRVGKPFYFLIADNWCTGFDSRYFGPVCATALHGRPIAVIWSVTPGKPWWRGTRPGRIGKLVS